jgi:hypothetical protein
MKLVCLFLSTILMTGCSVYQAANQPGPADLQGIGVGTPRMELISRLGAPKMVDQDAKGNKQDYFEFISGLHQASKARIVLYLAADVFTLTLAEVLIWPLELTAMDAAKCNGIATYDQDQKVTSWWVQNKRNSAQEC